MKLLEPMRHPQVRAAERLEAEISELAAHLAAATCRLLLLIAEFDRLDGWAGHRSCAHWLSWRCGLSGSTAREHVRVAHALEERPLIREAFATGRLSYSKVRALTRVAHAANEAELLQTAQATTAAQLDRIVQAMRNATRDQIRQRHERRTLRWRWDDDGTFVLSIRLDPDEGALALAALRAAQSPEPHDEPTGEQGFGERPAEPAFGAPSTQPHDERAGTPGTSPRSARTASQPATTAPTPDDTVQAHTSLRGDVSASAEAPPRWPLPESPGNTLVDAFVAITTSYLGSAARDAADSEAVQLIVLTDAITSTAPSRTTLAATGQTATPGDTTGDTVAMTCDTTATAGNGDVLSVAVLPADAASEGVTPVDGCADDGRPGGLTDTGIALPRDTVLRMACTAMAVHAVINAEGTPMDTGRRTRKISSSLRRAMRIRDAWTCRFPGCTTRRRLHAHHVRHWADGGETSLANLVSLCPAHHWAVHEGGHLMWIDETGHLRFRDPHGRPVPPAPPTGPATGALITTSEDITADTIVPDWDGTPLDLDNAVLALLQEAYAPPASPANPAVAADLAGPAAPEPADDSDLPDHPDCPEHVERPAA